MMAMKTVSNGAPPAPGHEQSPMASMSNPIRKGVDPGNGREEDKEADDVGYDHDDLGGIDDEREHSVTSEERESYDNFAPNEGEVELGQYVLLETPSLLSLVVHNASAASGDVPGSPPFAARVFATTVSQVNVYVPPRPLSPQVCAAQEAAHAQLAPRVL